MQAASVPQEKLDQFMAITGADKGRAGFFLEAANMDVSLAVDQFFSSDASSNQTSGNIRTMGQQTGRRPGRGTDNEEGGEEEGQEFYAGGANKQHGGGSSVNIVGPSKKKAKGEKADADKLATEMFKKLREAGASENDPNQAPSSFAGVFNTTTGQNNAQQVASERESTPNLITLRLWENGFSIDDGETQGELQSYDTEENKKMLEELKAGYIPKELVEKHKKGKLHLEMEDRRDEQYKEKEKPKYIAFSGDGSSLGAAAAAPSTSSTSVEVEDGFEVKVLLSQPTTQIQIRLADNTRIVQKFNTTHKVADLRKFIASKSKKSTFKIMTAYPSKPLEDDNLTLEEAGVLNSSVMQRWPVF